MNEQVRPSYKPVLTSLFSCVYVQMYAILRMDVPRSFCHASGMDQQGKERAARLLRTVAGERGMAVARVAALAGVDPGTVNDFWEGRRWPRVQTRTAIESVLGLELGEFERVARQDAPDPTAVDPVEAAIERSGLSRSNRAKLLSIYYDMVDSQERGATG